MSEPRTVSERITDYLASGGLFNPELANHDAVRDLLIDARDELAAEKASRAALLAGRPDVAELVRKLDGGVCFASTLKEWPNALLQRSARALESLAAQLAASQEEVRRLREALEWVKSDIEICDWHCERCGKDYEMKETDMAAVVRAALDKEPTR